MRPIKFRGKAMLTAERMEELEIPHENRWVCGYLIDNYITGEVVDADDGFIAPEWWAKVVPETVGQYTGLKEKNGKEIYEGDIIKADLPQKHYDGLRNLRLAKGKVYFDKGSFKVTDRRVDVRLDDFSNDAILEVLGNIHDNPEILHW